MTISTAIITGDQLRHKYFVNRLSERFDVRVVIAESVYQPTLEGNAEDLEDLECHFQERAEAELQFFGGDSEFHASGAKILSIPKGEANSDEVFQLITGENPDYLILYGSSIIRERLLERFDRRTINMHLGLSPYYRGSGTNFWPLVNREPELVGVTIHLATLDVDAGAILKQVRPEVTYGDRNHQIGCKAIIAGTRAMVDSVIEYDRGERIPQDQAPGGRLYRRKDFNIEAVRKMWQNFDEGMIEDYLDHPERVDRYPIVE